MAPPQLTGFFMPAASTTDPAASNQPQSYAPSTAYPSMPPQQQQHSQLHFQGGFNAQAASFDMVSTGGTELAQSHAVPYAAPNHPEPAPGGAASAAAPGATDYSAYSGQQYETSHAAPYLPHASNEASAGHAPVHQPASGDVSAPYYAQSSAGAQAVQHAQGYAAATAPDVSTSQYGGAYYMPPGAQQPAATTTSQAATQQLPGFFYPQPAVPTNSSGLQYPDAASVAAAPQSAEQATRCAMTC